jgi:hypothetical protein
LGGCDVNAWVGDWSFSVSAFPGSDARDCSLVRIFTRASKIDLKIVWPRLDLNMLKRPMCLCFSFYALVSILILFNANITAILYKKLYYIKYNVVHGVLHEPRVLHDLNIKSRQNANLVVNN